jgi:outer membrane protein
MRLRSVLLSVALATGAGAFVTMISSADAQAENLSVVYVDTDKVLYECDEGKAANDALKIAQGKRQEEIGARETEIKKLQDDLEKQAKAFSAAAIEKKAAQYQQSVVEYQTMVTKYNKELSDRERELFDPIEKRLKDLLRTIALREGYDMILNKRSVPYGRKDLDQTEKITQEYNKMYPGKAPPPAKAEKTPAKKPAPAPAPAPAGKK